MGLTAKIITGGNEIRQFEEAWKNLYQKIQTATVFQSWEWQSTWIDTFQRDLYIVAVYEGNDLIGILPFYRETKRFFSILKLTGSRDSDYLDFLILTGHEEPVIRFFFTDFLAGESSIGMVELDSIPETSPNRPIIESILKSGDYRINIREKTCPYIELPGTWEKYLETLSSSTRYFIKRKERKLEREFDVTTGYAETKEEVERRMDDFIHQHQGRWKTKQRPGAFGKDSFADFHKEAALQLFATGKLRLYYLELAGKPVASYYLFFDRNTFYFYLSGFEPDYGKYSVSSVLLARAIRDAIGLGLKEFDLMRGEGAYKFKWTEKKRRNRTYFIEKKRFSVFLYSATSSFTASVAGMIKNSLPYSLKNKIRSFLPKGLIKLLDPFFQE